MKNWYISFFSFVIAICISSCSYHTDGNAKPADLGPLPDNSIYQLDAAFTTQHGEEVQWSSFRGKPVVVAMVFTNCEFACPMITQDIKKLQSKLPEEKQENVEFLLISFDTKRDTAATLQSFAREMDLDERWTLLHGSVEDVRQMSMLLDVRYKDVGNGLFSHDNVIHLLNANGEIVARSEGLGKEINNLLEKIKHL